MDEITLLVEGIENKVKKLTVRNGQLNEKIGSLENDIRELQAALVRAEQKIKQMDREMTVLEAARSFDSTDTHRAKQKINELLREIEKTTVLLNR